MITQKIDLQIAHVSKSFSRGPSQTVLLSDLSYSFAQGTSYALTGVSGAGKSTLLHIMAGLEVPTSGFVQLVSQGKPLSSSADFLQKHIGIIFQVPYLIDELTLLENVMIKGLITRQEYSTSEQKARALLDKVGLSDKADQRPLSLSGGEQQRVAVARALFLEPSFILADEPTAHLDSVTAHDLLSVVRSCQKEHKRGLIIASHDPLIAQELDVHIKLVKGSLVEQPSVIAGDRLGDYTVERHG